MKLKQFLCISIILSLLFSLQAAVASETVLEIDGATLNREYPGTEYSGYPSYSSLLSSLACPKDAGQDYNVRHGFNTLSYLGISIPADSGLSKSLTRSEALAFLYKLLKRDTDYEKPRQEIQSMRAGSRLNFIDEWADAYYILALNDGLITKSQFDAAYSPYPNINAQYSKTAYITKQEFMVFLAKLLNLPLAEEIYYIKFYTDFGFVPKNGKRYVDALLKADIKFDTNAKTLDPNGFVSYKDFLYITAKLDEFTLKAEGLTQRIATVSDIFYENDGTYFKFSIDQLSYDLIKTDPALKFPYTAGDAVSSSDDLVIGDKVVYYTNGQSEVVFCEIINRNGSDAKNVFKATTIIRGKLFLYDQYSNSLILSDAKRSIYGSWESAAKDGAEFYKIPLSSLAEIYAGDERISVDRINTEFLDTEVVLTCGTFRSSPVFEVIRMGIAR